MWAKSFIEVNEYGLCKAVAQNALQNYCNYKTCSIGHMMHSMRVNEHVSLWWGRGGRGRSLVHI